MSARGRLRALGAAMLATGLVVAGCASAPVVEDPAWDEACELARRGTPARAIVLDSRETGVVVEDAVELELTVRVLPEVGEAFEAVARLAVNLFVAPQLEPGRFVPVRFDPADPSRVAVDLMDCPGELPPGGER